MAGDAGWQAEMRGARAAGRGLFTMQLYCGNSDCPVREVEVRFKDYDDVATAMMTRLSARGCPACGETCTVHWSMSVEQMEEEAAREARRSVNRQLRLAAAVAEGRAVVFETVKEMMDDRLPGVKGEE